MPVLRRSLALSSLACTAAVAVAAWGAPWSAEAHEPGERLRAEHPVQAKRKAVSRPAHRHRDRLRRERAARLDGTAGEPAAHGGPAHPAGAGHGPHSSGHRPGASDGHGRAGSGGHGTGGSDGHGHGHGLETAQIFGFTFGSSVHAPGEKHVATESTGFLGKRLGTYRGLDQKLELHFGAVPNLDVAFAALGDCHRVRNVPDLEDVRGRCAFNGFGTEFRWRLLDWEKHPFGLTLFAEPTLTRIDELSGKGGRGLASENKIILDKELVKDTLFGAANLVYDVERFHERGATAAERGSVLGGAGALAYRVLPSTFVGGEVRYLRAYDGLALGRYQGDAWYVGPSMFTQLSKSVWISSAWNVQVAGREAVDRREVLAGVMEATAAGEDPNEALPIRHGRLNLRDFTRHQFRLKMAVDF